MRRMQEGTHGVFRASVYGKKWTSMKQSGKRTALLAGVFGVLLLASGCGKAQIGYIDPHRVEETPQIKSLDDEMKEKLKEMQTQAENDLKAKEAQGAKPEDLMQQQQQAVVTMRQLGSSYDQQKLLKVQTAVGEIARTKKLDAVVYNAEEQKLIRLGGVDITDDVLNALQ